MATGGGGGREGHGEVGAAGPDFAVALTHDVDNLWRWTRRGFAASGYRSLRGLRRLDMTAITREVGDVAHWLTHHLPRRTDPHWTFPQMLAGEDARRVNSTFFVIARHTHRQDGNQPAVYQSRISEVLGLLRRARREVGLHGNDSDRLGVSPLSDDRNDLRARAGNDVRGVRYHYLRCLYHETLPFIDAAGIDYDSSLAFAEHEGFRCGTALPFHPYLLAEERPLRLVELPLAIMDTTLQQPQYRGLEAPAAEEAARGVLERVREAGGGVAVLWHNMRFDRRSAQGYDDVYWRLVDWVLAGGGTATAGGVLVDRWRRALGEDVFSADIASPPRTGDCEPAPRAGTRPAGATARRAVTRVLQLSVVHRPDDPRIYERECRTLVEAGHQVAYMAPGDDSGPDAHGVLHLPLPARPRAQRALYAPAIVNAVRQHAARRRPRPRPRAAHALPRPAAARATPGLRHARVRRRSRSPPSTTSRRRCALPPRAHAAVGQRTLAALADGVVAVTTSSSRRSGSVRRCAPCCPTTRASRASPPPEPAAGPRRRSAPQAGLRRQPLARPRRGCHARRHGAGRPTAAVLYLGGTFADPRVEPRGRGARLAGELGRPCRLLGRVPPAEVPGYPRRRRRRLGAGPADLAVRPADGRHEALRGSSPSVSPRWSPTSPGAASSYARSAAASPSRRPSTATCAASGDSRRTATAVAGSWANAAAAPCASATRGRSSRAVW